MKIDELQSILGELFFSFKEKVGNQDDIFSKVISNKIEKQKERDQDNIYDLWLRDDD